MLPPSPPPPLWKSAFWSNTFLYRFVTHIEEGFSKSYLVWIRTTISPTKPEGFVLLCGRKKNSLLVEADNKFGRVWGIIKSRWTIRNIYSSFFKTGPFLISFFIQCQLLFFFFSSLWLQFPILLFRYLFERAWNSKRAQSRAWRWCCIVLYSTVYRRPLTSIPKGQVFDRGAQEEEQLKKIFFKKVTFFSSRSDLTGLHLYPYDPD